MKLTKTYLKDLVYKINGAAIEVHRELGPGLLESVYHKFMIHELSLKGISFESELTIPILYKGQSISSGLRCDLLIEGQLVVELKAVDEIHPIHKAQILSYMELLKISNGLLINFNVSNIFHEGQQTFVNESYRNLPV